VDYGIDVSRWNDVGNWAAVRGNNITFAIQHGFISDFRYIHWVIFL